MTELIPNVYQIQQTLNLGLSKFPGAMQIIQNGEELILIDPLELDQPERDALEALGKPTLILIDGPNHERDSDAYRTRYGAKIMAHPDAVPKLNCNIDDTFQDGDTLPGNLTALLVPGTQPGETIFLRETLLFVSDALMNFGPKDCGLIMRCLGFPNGLGPMPKLFMSDK